MLTEQNYLRTACRQRGLRGKEKEPHTTPNPRPLLLNAVSDPDERRLNSSHYKKLRNLRLRENSSVEHCQPSIAAIVEKKGY